MPITFQCLPVADRMVRSPGISVAGSRSSDPSPPTRIPACIEPRSPVRMPSLHALHGCGEPESGVNLFEVRHPTLILTRESVFCDFRETSRIEESYCNRRQGTDSLHLVPRVSGLPLFVRKRAQGH